MARPKSLKPAYCHDRTNNRAFVTLSAQRHSLGRYGTQESRDLYDRLVGEWIASGRAPLRQDAPCDLSVVSMLLRFWEHAQSYYASDRGRGEAANFKSIIKLVGRLYSDTPAIAFGPNALRAVRDALIAQGLCRTNVNAQVNRLRRIFKWAVSRELIPASVWHALQSVEGLRRGKTSAREPEPVRPAADAHVDAVLPFLSRQVRAMVLLQVETGMRPAEVCILRTIDVDRSQPIWVYRPHKHKTEHHGHAREVFLSYRAQELLAPWLGPDLHAYAFRPIDAVEEKKERRTAARQTKAGQGNGPGTNRKAEPKRVPGECYTPNSYRQAVARACDLAFQILTAEFPVRPETWEQHLAWRRSHRWHPNQLRHSFGTRVRRTHGLEVAQVLLGHKHANVTEIYAERDRAAAERAVACL